MTGPGGDGEILVSRGGERHWASNELAVDPALFPFLRHLAPGVVGYTTTDGDGLFIPLIVAEQPGSGAVGRYLDGLPLNRRVVVPNVLSDRLRGMLARRGFVETREAEALDSETITIWERVPA